MATTLDVAGLLGRSAEQMARTYGHIFPEYGDRPPIDAEAEICAARAALVPATYP